MIVNSISFLLFFLVVFGFYYWRQHSNKWQNMVLLLANGVFYAWADYRMLLLLSLAIIVFYGLGLGIERTKSYKNRNLISCIGCVSGALLLLYFKYLNFFIESFAALFTSIGIQFTSTTIDIVMPLGISFFTFKLISYIVDVRRGELHACKNIVVLANYISFFPTILSGPIDKATNLLPQFDKAHSFNYAMAVDGCRQILWGMFKKMVIADGLALYTNVDTETAVGSTLLIVSVYYSIQLYCDFSGYSDMAIGVGKLLGFNVSSNFRYPYFSRSISEFWKRWHISLLTWFRYYVYIPLGGNRCPKWKVIRNTFVIFLISGLWHGANWTFVVWGLLHALFFMPALLLNTKREKVDFNRKYTYRLPDIFKMCVVFVLVNFAWIIFHSIDINQAWIIFTKIFGSTLFARPVNVLPALPILVFACIMFVYEWLALDKEYAMKLLPARIVCRWGLYILLVLLIVFYQGKPADFIYFNF